MRNVSRIVAAVALMFVAASASAQNSTLVRATVPFPFEVAGQLMPAGEYRFSLNLINGLVMITGPDRNSISFLSSYEGRLQDGNSRLRFVRVDGDSFLSEIAFSGSAQRVPLAAKNRGARGDAMARNLQLLLIH